MLKAELVLDAYRQGAFPMAVAPTGEIGWFAPDPRAIIPLDDRFHVPHGLRRVLHAGKFAVTFDAEFTAVIRACADRRDGTWISPEIIECYTTLHETGYAHSVETWHDSQLAGGLYGVHLGGAFFGESMFHRATDASKVALAALVERLRQHGFTLLDTQWLTPHLAQFGAYEISRRAYRQRLAHALAIPCAF